MKKKIKTGLTIVVLVLMIMYAVYDFAFPRAEKLDYPDFSLIESVTVSKYDEAINLSQVESELLYTHISYAKPTRKRSVNDTPYVTPFYTVAIKSEDSSVSGDGYIYEEQGKTYFEIPYVGIYILDSDALKYIKNNLNRTPVVKGRYHFWQKIKR